MAEDDVILLLLLFILIRRRKRRRSGRRQEVRKRKCWVREIYPLREQKGEYANLVRELQSSDRELFYVNVLRKEITFEKVSPIIKVCLATDSLDLTSTSISKARKTGRKRSAAKLEDEDLVKKIKRGEDVERNKRQKKELEEMNKEHYDTACRNQKSAEDKSQKSTAEIAKMRNMMQKFVTQTATNASGSKGLSKQQSNTITHFLVTKHDDVIPSVQTVSNMFDQQ
ncbi:hypothetical protein ACROYT_G014124 [Oculina patagonica]